MPVSNLLRCRVAPIAAALTFGCATPPPDVAPDLERTSRATPSTEQTVPVARHGRYTLVELIPEPAQRDLMRQVVEVSIPPSLDANVGEALRHALRHSGFRLCEREEAAPLYALPLPASHRRLGPLSLRDTLATLAGPAWEVSVDDASRQVCFKRHAETGSGEVQS